MPQSEIPFPERHQLRAARGWLELGNPREAEAELQSLHPDLGRHADVLELRWQIGASRRQWETCADLGQLLTVVAPERPTGWIHRSFALHELDRTQEAFDHLLPQVDRFPEDATMPYNLACYASRLGRFEAARRWLGRAFAIPGSMELSRTARTDPDLAPYWQWLQDGELSS